MSGKNNGRILLNVTHLKYLRKKKGLTQDDLALDCRINRLAVSISSVKRAESGQKVLYRTALSLARYYGVNIADIMCDSEVNPATVEPPPRYALGKPIPRTTPDKFTYENQDQVITEGNPYLIVLLVETIMADEKEIKNYLRHLNISFAVDFPYTMVSISQEDCGIEVFRYFRHISRLLLAKYRQHIRVCAHVVRIPPLADQEPSTFDKTGILPDSIFRTMRAILGLTEWGSISACSCIASSGACTPLSHIETTSSVAEGWSNICVIQPYRQFVGRQWELSQLRSGYHSVTQSHQGITVYLEGMEGIGKTALIHHFINSLKINKSDTVLLDMCHLSVARLSALQCLARQLLSLPLQAGEAIVRHKISSSTISITLQVFICLMAGVTLRNTETRLLKAMGRERREAAISEALAELIDQRLTDGPLLLIIEDLYLADADFTEVVKVLALLAQSKPFLLCISARKSGKYSHRPAWLEHARIIELTGLTQSQSTALSNTVLPTNTDYSRECVDRAFGHPGYLLQMLHAGEHSCEFKAAMHMATAFKLNSLSTTDLMALKIAAVHEEPLSLEHWQAIVIPLLGDPNAIHTPQTLVYAGFFKHVSDSYTFQHPVIREAILDRITKQEQRRIEQAIQQCNSKWNLLSEPSVLSPEPSDDFNTLTKQAIENATYFQYKRAFELYQAATRIAPLEARANLFNRTASCLLSQGKVADSLTFHQHALNIELRDCHTERYRIDLANVYDLMGKYEKVIEVTQNIGEDISRTGIASHWDTLAEMHAVRGSCRLYSGCLKEARVDYQQAVYCSTNTMSPRSKALALAGLAKCCYAQGRMQEAFENYIECLKLCEKSGLLSIESEVRAMLTRIRLFRLETTKAIEDGQQAVMLAHHTGNIRAELIARLSLSWTLLEVNAYNQARREIAAGLTLARKARAPRYIASLLESKARLLWLTGTGNKAVLAINHALDIVKGQSLERFTGSWFSATKALISGRRDESYQALAQGEEWLQAPSVAHNVLNFYKQAIYTAWQLKDAGLLKKYHSRLHDYNSDMPTKWAELYMSQADLMLNLIKGSATASALKKFNKRAGACNMLQLQFDLSTL